MSELALTEILAGTGGELRGALSDETVFDRIERDSRQTRPGDLFVAVRGERFDGHDFIADAAARGAMAALAGRAWADAQAEPPLPLIVVDEPVAALQRLAGHRRQRLGVTIVGITGSVGKTSAKEAAAAVLSTRFQVYKSPGNFNNEIGLPLSLLEMDEATEIGVFEMGGAYAMGELALLAQVAQPRIGVVTNVYPVHLERMGTIEAIAETKAELVDALPADGTAILNGDDDRVRAMATRCRGRVITYGLDKGNDIRADTVTSDGLEGTTFWLTIDGDRSLIKVPFVGGHGVQIALVAIAVGHALGLHISEMLVGLKDPAVQVRLLFALGPRGSQLIDDTYNASTPSVLSALGLLDDLKPGRRIAVLGDMRELGDVAEDEHRIVGRRAAETVDLLVTYGELAKIIAQEAAAVTPADVDTRPPDVTSFDLDQRQNLVDYLRQELREGDIVLLKGSRGLQMEEIVAALRVDAGHADLDPEPSTEAGERP